MGQFPPFFERYLQIFEDYFGSQPFLKDPKGLDIPIAYICSQSGKRIRPLMALLATESVGSPLQNALDVSVCVELFHNFTLIHDDVMDNSPLRRGVPSVHEKWDINTAILAGDSLLTMSYMQLERYPKSLNAELTKLLTSVSYIVCKGQYSDIRFESQAQVSIPNYIEMIEQKTAWLFGCALKMGAICCNTTKEISKLFFDIGCSVGIAFQIQDDLLDVFGNTKIIGKQIGTDIRNQKKTVLYLVALKQATTAQRKELLSIYAKNSNDIDDHVVKKVTNMFADVKADVSTKKLLNDYLSNARMCIDRLNNLIKDTGRLHEFVDWIDSRER